MGGESRGTASEPVTESVEDVMRLLRRGGARVTTSRRLLVEALFQAASGHRTAEQLAAELQVRAPDVHLSTIYRNLEELERLGVVTQTHLGHGPATYQLASFAHAHFICEVCGAHLDAPDDLFKGLALSARRRLGFTIDPHHFAILGRCHDCS